MTAVGAVPTIPLCAPQIGGNAWAYVQDCLDTHWVSSVGAYVERFEAMLAERVGTRYAVATASGTAALHLALLAAGVERDDEVLVSALTFIAPANAIRYVGAWPVFVDAEPGYWQMDAGGVADFVERRCAARGDGLYNRDTGRRVGAILPVHILGHPADMDPLIDLARRYGLAVIEDATESLGAAYLGRPVGRLGDVACFSFNGNKMITTGGGGMLVTDDADVARRARYLSTQAKDDGVEYVHRAIGYNYRLTNLQAALGVAQLEQLNEHLAAKRRIAGAYARALDGLPGVTLMPEAPWARSAWWLYTILLDDAQAGIGSRQLMQHLAEQGIQTRPLWQPIHRSPAHAGSERRDCPVADRLHHAALSLPCSVGLDAAVQQSVIAQVLEILGRASR